jgi:hypothetical protein
MMELEVLNMETTSVLRSKFVYITSIIIATKSPYFYKICKLRFLNKHVKAIIAAFLLAIDIIFIFVSFVFLSCPCLFVKILIVKLLIEIVSFYVLIIMG